jgi:hypothetical protein
MSWKQLLAYSTGSVDQESIEGNESLGRKIAACAARSRDSRTSADIRYRRQCRRFSV